MKSTRDWNEKQMEKVTPSKLSWASVLLLCAAYGTVAADAPEPELVLLNWSDYMDPAVIEENRDRWLAEWAAIVR